jgi:hypothetical protein
VVANTEMLDGFRCESIPTTHTLCCDSQHIQVHLLCASAVCHSLMGKLHMRRGSLIYHTRMHTCVQAGSRAYGMCGAASSILAPLLGLRGFRWWCVSLEQCGSGPQCRGAHPQLRGAHQRRKLNTPRSSRGKALKAIHSCRPDA